MKLEDLIVAIKKQSKKIFIFGAGQWARVLVSQLLTNGLEVERLLVTDISINARQVLNIPVEQVDGTFHANKAEDIMIIGMRSLGTGEVRTMLEEMGWVNIYDCPSDMLQYDVSKNYKITNPMLEITTVIGCSANCKYCPQKLLISQYSKQENAPRELSFDCFKKCLEKLPSNTLISFAGMAEPFQNKRCSDMLVYAHQKGFKLMLYTTAQYMTMDDFDKIKDIPFLRVDLHVPDKNRYSNIPVTREYLYKLKVITEYVRKDGVQFITSANGQSEPDPRVTKVINGKTYITFHKLIDRAGNIEEDNIVKHTKYKSGCIECEESVDLNSNVLLPDGTVLLCCNDYGMHHILGNLLVDSYNDISHGQTKESIKRRLMCQESGEVICRKCNVARECSC